MRILTRYVLREFLIPFTYSVIGFLGIYIVFELFDSFNRIMEAKPPATQVLAFFAGYVSPYLEWLIPAALLLGTPSDESFDLLLPRPGRLFAGKRELVHGSLPPILP